MCISTYKYLIALVGSILVLFMENYNVFFFWEDMRLILYTTTKKKKIMLVDRFFMLTLHKTKMIT